MPHCDHNQNSQICKNSIGFKKTDRINGEMEGTKAKHGGNNFQKFRKNSRRISRRNLDFQTRSRLRLRPITAFKESNE